MLQIEIRGVLVEAEFLFAYLDKSNIGGLFTEALTADVKAVLSDETSLVCADAAVRSSSAEAQDFPFKSQCLAISLSSAFNSLVFVLCFQFRNLK